MNDFTIVFNEKASEIPPDLWHRCIPPPLEGLWWYETLEESCLGDQFQFFYAVVWRGQEPVAIAPLFTMDVPIEIVAPPAAAWLLRRAGRLWPRLLYQRTLFVGSPCSDEGTVGTLPGVDLATFAPTLQRALVTRGKQMGTVMIVWKDFPQKTWRALRALSESAGLFEVVSFPNTTVRDVRGGFEAYLNQLSSSRRYKLLNKLRRSRHAAHLYSEVVIRPDKNLLEEIWALFQATYAKAPLKFERLTKRFWQRITLCGVSRVIILRDVATRRPVAFMLVFLSPGWAINKYIGIDYSQNRESYLYFRLWEEFIRWAQAQGVTGVQSGQTAYRAKLDLGHELVPLTNFARHLNPILHLIFARVAKGISWSTLDSELQAVVAARARRDGRNAGLIKSSGEP